MKISNSFICNFKKIFVTISKTFFISLGAIFTLMIILSFTTLPFWMYYKLGITNNALEKPPDYIVVLGGGGFPSESSLMRTYKASQISLVFPSSKIIIALPGDTMDLNSSIVQMKEEIISRGINNERIILEPVGRNTRMQALEISKLISPDSDILIVTSPEHMYRSIRSFKAVGLKNTNGESAFESAIESLLIFDDDKLGGNKYLPDIGGNTQFRYQFWNHFKYQIIVYREYLAIAYYKLKGWI